MELLSPSRLAGMLASIYKKNFGEQNQGRYQISREQLAEISQRQIIHDSYIEEVNIMLLEHGYILVNLGYYFVVLNQKSISNLRKIPQSLIDEHVIVVEDDEVGRVTLKDVKKIDVKKYI